VTGTSDRVIDRSAEPRVRHSALADATLVFLSPVLYPLEIFLGIFPGILIGWTIGVILLWFSRSWTAGQKLIGMLLSGASVVSSMVIHVESAEPIGTGAAFAILSTLLLLIAMPAIVGVIYLVRRRRPRPPRRSRARPAREEAVSVT
jgi:hypothetical protein